MKKVLLAFSLVFSFAAPLASAQIVDFPDLNWEDNAAPNVVRASADVKGYVARLGGTKFAVKALGKKAFNVVTNNGFQFKVQVSGWPMRVSKVFDATAL